MLAQNSSGSDNYSDDYEQNDFEDDGDDGMADAKLQKLRKAMASENKTADKVVKKHNIQVKRAGDDSAAKPTLKMGPMVGKGKVNMAQITREVDQMQPSQGGL